MKFGFTTLGCPDLSLAGAGALAGEFGLDFIELRALENSLDLPGYFRANPPPRGFPTEIRVVSTAYFLEDPDPRKFAICLEHAELAVRLEAPYIRIFAGRGDEEAGLPVIQAAAQCADRLRAEIDRRGWAVEPILETHSGFSFTRPCEELNRRLDRPLGHPLGFSSHVEDRRRIFASQLGAAGTFRPAHSLQGLRGGSLRNLSLRSTRPRRISVHRTDRSPAA
jgi:hypothetical protein